MQTVMWQKRRVLVVTVVAMVMYMIFKKNPHVYNDEAVLKGVKADKVWEFLADFSNQKKHLIPHMQSFTITAESGNYDHWKYSVGYTEILPVWPYLSSAGEGHYSIRAEKDKYVISSTHTTCLFNGWACAKSICDFQMTNVNDQDSLYKEQITYECPVMFKGWCRRVAEHTRRDFVERLKNYYNKVNKN